AVKPLRREGRMFRLHLYAAVQPLLLGIAQWNPGASLAPGLPCALFQMRVRTMQSSGEMRREDDHLCLMLEKGLVPGRSAASPATRSIVRCDALQSRAHASASFAASWVPALRSSVRTLLRVRDRNGPLHPRNDESVDASSPSRHFCMPIRSCNITVIQQN
ncbi:hypothetical protein EAS56_25650, partial [Bradyrhizobium guangzhouense]